MTGLAKPPPRTATAVSPPARATRLAFIDNARLAMIILVLSMHAADTYSPLGNWYFKDPTPMSSAAVFFFATWQAYLQAFFMALLFFIAGCFAPAALRSRGEAGFIRERLLRLGAPTLLYVALIGPLTEYFIAHSWRTRESFGHEMSLYFTRGRFLAGTGPLWFCEALLIFSLGFVVLHRSVRPPAASLDVTWPGVAAVVAAIAVATFLVRLAAPAGTAFFNLQLGDFPSYVIMFALGILAAAGDWLTKVPDRFAWSAAAALVGGALIGWPLILAVGGALSGDFAPYRGGWTWQSAALSLWESAVCVGMAFVVLAAFRRFANRQGEGLAFLSAGAFAVYVLHPPVLIGLARLLHPLALPPIAKFVLLWALTAAIMFLFVAPAARRIPIVGRIL